MGEVANTRITIAPEILNKEAARVIKENGLDGALSDGRATLSEVGSMPYDTFRKLSRNRKEITTATVRQAVAGEILQAFSNKAGELYPHLKLRESNAEGTAEFSNFKLTKVRAEIQENADIDLKGIDLEYDWSYQGKGGKTSTTFTPNNVHGLENMLYNLVNGIDVDNDGKLTVGAEIGGPEGLTAKREVPDAKTQSVRNEASPLKAASDVAKIAGEDGEVTASDLFNYVVNAKLTGSFSGELPTVSERAEAPKAADPKSPKPSGGK